MASNILKIEAPIPGADATGMIGEITGNITAPTTVVFPSSVYNVSGRIPVSYHGTDLIGLGKWGTQFNFNPLTPSVLFDFEYHTPGAASLQNCSMRHIGIFGAGTVQKIPIRLGYCSGFNGENVWINNCTSTGHDSIGLQIQGQDFHSFKNLTIVADNPISIEQNPYYELSLDETDFYHTHLSIMNPEGAGIKIAPGCMLVDITFDGALYFSGGKYSVYWVDPDPELDPWKRSARIRLNNGRHEVPVDATGYGIYINGPMLEHVHINNWVADRAGNGFFLRNANWFTMEHCQYRGDKEALNLDATSKNIVLTNNQFEDSYFNPDATRSMEGLTKTFDQPPLEIWQPS